MGVRLVAYIIGVIFAVAVTGGSPGTVVFCLFWAFVCFVLMPVENPSPPVRGRRR
ncbi:MAG: hypothetical protein ABWZ30_00945 [Jiangellaceae bacterium]